ncbi:unnamed protein product [Knipowitschia caucasica]
MDPMYPETYVTQGAKRKFPFGHHQNPNKRGKAPNRQPSQNTDKIVYSHAGNILMMQSISSELAKITDSSIIGLQYVWEYRSPSKSVQPHYVCKLCSVNQVQQHMIQHIKGWKHMFRYIKKTCPEKFPHEEESIGKDQEIKVNLKQVAAEIEKTEGRGQLKVILKEPCELPAFKDFSSAIPGATHPPAGYRRDGFGGYSTLQTPSDYSVGRTYYDDGGYNQTAEEYGAGVYDYGQGSDFDGGRRSSDYDRYGGAVDHDGYGGSSGYDGYGRPSDYLEERRGPMERPMMRPSPRPVQRPMSKPALPPPRRPAGPPALGGDCSGTLLSYLDTFKIENESDAELVLKVTQKLTDVLMEYRLRHSEVTTASSMYPPSKPTFREQFSGAGLPMHPPSRFFK